MVTMNKKQNNAERYSCDSDGCEIRDAMLIIGGKWKSMIMHILGQHETIRFNRLKTMIPKISQKMLTQQLRELERDGLVQRQVYPEMPPRVEYTLTEMGMSIGPLYKTIHQWQKIHIDDIEQCRNAYDQSLKAHNHTHEKKPK